MKKDYPKFKNYFEKKGNLPSFVVMNLIWLMLTLTHGGLILVLQSILKTLCGVYKT